jgi:hypothetical protein
MEPELDRPNPAAPPKAAGVAGAGRPAPSWLLALAGGLVAGLAASFAAEATHGHFRVVHVNPPNWDKMGSYDKQDYIVAEHRTKTPPAEAKNAAVAYGLLGGLLGVGLGLAGGLARRSVGAGLLAAAVGLVFGVGAGAGMSAVAIPRFYQFLTPENGVVVALLTHLAVFAAVGAAAGLAFGLGAGGRGSAVRGLLGGLVGGALGTVAFEVIFAVGMPLMRLEHPIPPERVPRLLIHLAVALLAAGGAALAVRPPRPAEAPAAEIG